MAQVLKDEIRDRILHAAEAVFYEKDYRSAKLTEIAKEANVPVALIYTYFKNKASLFDAIVKGIFDQIIQIMDDEEKLESNCSSERFKQGGEKNLPLLFKERKKLIILIDKSAGTKHEQTKGLWVDRLAQHLEEGFQRDKKDFHDPMVSHILANNYVEGIMEIARHYQGEVWAKEMFSVLNKCYFTGVESL